MGIKMRNLFTEHPASVGETYFEHMGQAMSFSAAMFFGSLVCLLHALLPWLFLKTGSGIIQGLYERMVAHRVTETGATRLEEQQRLAAR
jgi:hypothetical protein